jgi:hypothetical protein
MKKQKFTEVQIVNHSRSMNEVGMQRSLAENWVLIKRPFTIGVKSIWAWNPGDQKTQGVGRRKPKVKSHVC